MQINWEDLIAQHYPRFNPKRFQRCVQEVREYRISSEEFLYIVLGCGYLFHVRKIDPKIQLKRLKERLGNPLFADLLIDEKKALRKIAKLGLVIGPKEHPLTQTDQRGPKPRPTARIALLTIETWMRKKKQGFDHIPFACNLYHALSSMSIQSPTVLRMKKKAEQEKVRLYLPDGKETEIPVIDHLLGMFESRYERYKREYEEQKRPVRNLLDLYPIQGVLSKTLKSVGVDFPSDPKERIFSYLFLGPEE